MRNLNDKILGATKWSAITEIIAKLIVPITNMILARILAPEAFGVIATITMIISFVDMFTDAGFQKFLIQYEFKSEEDLNLFANVAFWTNLIISIVLWSLIIIFSDRIAYMVGNNGLGNVIAIACIQLPLTSFSSIQMSIYRRNFDFKTLFAVRIVSILIPFLITIPLAFLGFSYWSLILGNIVSHLFNAIILTLKSTWKPRLVYKFEALKDMLSFSIWTLIESISIWLTTWIDTFIIGSMLNQYYLGIYKTSMSMVNSIFLLVTASTTPILFSALSRVQDNDLEFKKIFFTFQKIVSYLVFPISIGIFIFSDFVVKILLGDKWSEASGVISIWGLISGILIIFSHYSSEIYRAKGKPKLSFLAQMLHLIVLIPICYIFVQYDFDTFVNARAIIRLESVFVNLIIMKYIFGITFRNIFNNIKYSFVASILMGILGLILVNISQNILWQIISILICIIVYILILFIGNESRKDIYIFIQKIELDKKLNLNKKTIIMKGNEK